MSTAHPYFHARSAKSVRAPTPAARIVAALGGPRRAAALAGVDLRTVYRWLTPRARGGTGGLVPTRAQLRLLERAPGLAHADFAQRPGEVAL